MEVWIGLIGALAGGAIALLGQYGLRRSERQDVRTMMLLEQCAQLVARSEDYRNRVWEERRLGVRGAVSAWGLSEFRLAEARLKILRRDAEVLKSLQRLQKTGEGQGKAWRPDGSDNEAVEAAWRGHQVALDDFVRLSGDLVNGRAVPRILGTRD
ncbi:MAG: hypothetical protein ACRDWG_14955 [Actinomycetes bacterium]